MPERPNILFFFCDDQRFNTIHALGNEEIITPNIDKLVEKGTVFTHAHIPGGTCGAVCMPSRAMLHTGRTLFHIQGEGQEISDKHILLGESLRRAGYRTFGTGKWHNGSNSYARSFTDGGSIFFGGMWDHWNVPVCDFDPTGKYENVINFTPNFSLNNKTTKVHCNKFSTGKHSTDLISDTAIDFLNRYNSDEPFFMYISFLAPHDPRTMPQQFMDMYDIEKIELPQNFAEEHPFDYGVSKIRDELLATYPRKPENIRKHIAEYYAMITHLDYAIGRVIEALERSGKADNTIIILSGDNGLAVGQHGLMGKQSNYEHSIRVPLIFAGPGIPSGQKLNNYAYLFDIYPTLCDLVGIEVPSSVEGKSLIPVINNPQIEIHSTMYFAYADLVRSVKDRRYKLIEYRGNVNITQLFDLENDPWEINNLYGKEDYNNIVVRLRYELERLSREWDDELHPLGRKFWTNYRNSTEPDLFLE